MREQTEPSMRLRTRLTERFDIEHPIISAPMGMIAGGRLAAAVSNAGGLGLIGGGYGEGGWLEREFSAATAFTSGDADSAGAFMGEAAGLIHDIRPAARIVEQMVAQAHGLLRHAGRFAPSG
jgi:NAD(P)H-dependent flavin oxidoreductase YrpB (nitropropane dioxygenase family)